MGVVVLCSAVGSPGVTTTALGLTLAWPRDVVLADCDRQPAQAVRAGFLQGGDSGGRGMASLAQAHRERRDLAGELLAHCLPLAEGSPRRVFLPGFAHPGSAGVFATVWADLARAFTELGESRTDVIVDAGRVGEGLPAPLLAAADVVLLGTRTTLRALAGARLYVPGLVDAAQQGTGQVGLCLVGPGQPYGVREIEQQFDLPVLVTVPLDADAAAVLSDAAPLQRRRSDTAYRRALGAAAEALSAQLQARERRVSGVS